MPSNPLLDRAAQASNPSPAVPVCPLCGIPTPPGGAPHGHAKPTDLSPTGGATVAQPTAPFTTKGG